MCSRGQVPADKRSLDAKLADSNQALADAHQVRMVDYLSMLWQQKTRIAFHKLRNV